MVVLALALGVLTLGTASIGAAFGGAGAVLPSRVAAATTDPLAQASATPVSAAPPVARSWSPLAAVGASPLADVRSERTCIASAAAVDGGAPAPLSTSAAANAVLARPRHAVLALGAPAAAPQTRPVAAFLGDSYTTGYNGSGLGAAGWPAIVSAALHLQALNRAVAGTGFVNPGWTAQPIWTRVGAVIRAHPRVVFLAAGHNDRRFGSVASGRAADLVIDRLHRALPDTILVVIGPIWANGNPPLSLRLLRDHLRRTAAALGAIFIDPLGGGWFAGTAARLIGPDGIHPTNAGHRHIAALVLQRLIADPRFHARQPSSTTASAPANPSTAAPIAPPTAGCAS